MHIELIDIPKITDPRGNLAVIEKNTLPFEMKRLYYLYDVPSTSHRGGHAHKECLELLIAISGSFTVLLDNGVTKQAVTLNKPDKGLLVPTMVWRELSDFSSGAMCLVVASQEFSETDYLREYHDFKLLAST